MWLLLLHLPGLVPGLHPPPPSEAACCCCCRATAANVRSVPAPTLVAGLAGREEEGGLAGGWAGAAAAARGAVGGRVVPSRVLPLASSKHSRFSPFA